MRFSLVNLGCRVNRVESDSFIAQLKEAGWDLSSDNPSLVIVNTCTVTGEAEKKTRKAVRHALREYPDAIIMVTGCAAAMNPDDYLSMSDRVRVVSKNAVVDAALALDESNLHGRMEVRSTDQATRYGKDFPTRVGIKIQDGCDNACTYCIVHVARGKSVSTPNDKCVSDALRQYQAGAREIVLTGIDLGNYDYQGLRLPGLLKNLMKAMPEARFRVSSIEPPSISKELISLMAESRGSVCKHLHIPLQSGSSKVLAEMDRHYSAQDFKDLVDNLYRSMPEMSISTDIIVGFPGETEEDFQETLDMVRYCRFSKVHIFRYSKRAGTPAAIRPDQIDPEVITRRAKDLKEVSDSVRLFEQQKRIGSIEAVLVEQKGIGTSESFFTVSVGEEIPRGSLVTVKLNSLKSNGVFCA